MKTLGLSQMVALLPIDQEESLRLAKTFEALAPHGAIKKGSLEYAVKEGFIDAIQVCINNDDPAFMLFFHITSDNGLHINACQTYGRDHDVAIGFAGIDRLAEKVNASYITFSSKRSGLIHEAVKYGYIANAVLMLKSK